MTRDKIHEQDPDTSGAPLFAQLRLYRSFLAGQLRNVTVLRERNERVWAALQWWAATQPPSEGAPAVPKPKPPPEPVVPPKLTARQRRRLAEEEVEEINGETHVERSLAWLYTPPPYLAPPSLFALVEKIAGLPDDIVEVSIPFEPGDAWVIAWREWIEFGPSEQQLREAIAAVDEAMERPELIEDAEAMERLRVERVPELADYYDMLRRFNERTRREREERLRARKAAEAARALARAQLPAEGVSQADDEAERQADGGNGEVP